MTFRYHRGGLVESMSTSVELPPTRESLANYLRESPCDVAVEYYAYDARLLGDVYIVKVRGDIVGFTDGALSQ